MAQDEWGRLTDGYEYFNQLNELVVGYRYLNQPDPGPIVIPKRDYRSPTKGDLVEYFEKRGTIGWVTSEDVNAYFGNRLEAFDRDLFSTNYTSRGGKTLWHL